MQAGLAQVAQGQGQVVGIVGDPGMGKSRLLAEFRQNLAGQAVTYYVGQCLPDAGDPVSAGARRGAAALWAPCHGPAGAVTVTVHRCVQEAGLRPEEAAPVLLQLLDIPVADAAFTQLSPEERKTRTFASCTS